LLLVISDEIWIFGVGGCQIRFFVSQFQHPTHYPPLANLIDLLLEYGVKLDLAIWVPRSGNKELKPSLQSSKCFQVLDSHSSYKRLIKKFWFSLLSLLWIWKHKPDFVIVCDLNSLLHAAFLKLFGRKTKLIYIEYDAPNDRVGLKDWLNRKIRSNLHRLDALAVFPSGARFEIFSRQTGINIRHCLLPNYPRRRELIDQIVDFGPYEQHLTLYYQGSFVPPRVPRALFEAIAMCSFVRFKIKGVAPIPDNFYQSTVESWIKELEIEDRVQFLQDVPDVEFLKRYAQQAHVGLAFYDMSDAVDINHSSMWGASNKLNQYLGYGLILLYATGELAVRQAVADFGLETNAHDPQDLARCLRQLHENLSVWNQSRRVALEKMQSEWNFEQGFHDFWSKLSELNA
jgi:glycosyltransferase involved in cell wall biosynthesis